MDLSPRGGTSSATAQSARQVLPSGTVASGMATSVHGPSRCSPPSRRHRRLAEAPTLSSWQRSCRNAGWRCPYGRRSALVLTTVRRGYSPLTGSALMRPAICLRPLSETHASRCVVYRQELTACKAHVYSHCEHCPHCDGVHRSRVTFTLGGGNPACAIYGERASARRLGFLAGRASGMAFGVDRIG